MSDYEYVDGNFDEMQELRAEIERLRAALNEMGDACSSPLGRDYIIEECARVAELWPFGNMEIASAIRALKDKP